jgi:DNA-directed RNA polymerase specialized sigma24 family protein
LQRGELSDTRDRHCQLNTVLELPHFERFVFVMSVLEHYSKHDSAILLGCSPWEIREAQARALAQLGKSPWIVSREANFERVQELSR